MSTPQESHKWLAEMLIKRKGGRNWSALERDITEVSRAIVGSTGKPVTIDRRKLKDFCEGNHNGEERTVRFSLAEFEALDAYLRRFSESAGGLSNIFEEKENIISSLFSNPPLTIIVGARYLLDDKTKKQSPYVALWDLRAMTSILSAVLHKTKEVRIETTEIAMGGGKIERQERQERVWKKLKSEKLAHRTMLSLGSPHSCHGTESILSEMIGVRTYFHDREYALPFYIVLDSELHYDSAFTLTKNEIEEAKIPEEEKNKIRDMKEGERALIVGKHVYISKRDNGIGYGLIIAQRHRPGGEMRIVIFGTHGPSTMAAAEIFSHGLIVRIPLQDIIKPEPIMVCIIKTEIVTEKGNEDKINVRICKDNAVEKPPFLLQLNEDDEWVEKK